MNGNNKRNLKHVNFFVLMILIFSFPCRNYVYGSEEQYGIVRQNCLYNTNIKFNSEEFIYTAKEFEAAMEQPVEYFFYQNGVFIDRSFYREALIEQASGFAGASVTAKGFLKSFNSEKETEQYVPFSPIGIFNVYQGSQFLESFEYYEEAVNYGAYFKDGFIFGEICLWTNADIRLEEDLTGYAFEFCHSFIEAAVLCNEKYSGEICYIVTGEHTSYDKGKILWSSQTKEGQALIENVPFINQNPQLPRGCEVTALAMLLNYHEIEADKMVLAEGIRKAPNHYDNPNNGFIGDMYSLTTHGLGVYHSPIAELAENYAPGRVLDITGTEFENLFYYLENNMPVWIVNNSRYAHMPDSEFVTWQTAEGPVKVTRRMHAVVMTGYDDKYIYFNDPLSGGYLKNGRRAFSEGWRQMGSQAIVLLEP